MSLFRRKPREAQEPGEKPAAPPSSAAPAPTGAARPAKGTTSARLPSSGGPPPPLPQPSPAAATATPSTLRFFQCFVCDSPLEGGRCPKCRITWVE